MAHAIKGAIQRTYVSEQMRILIRQLNVTADMLQIARADESMELTLTQATRVAQQASDLMRRIANAPAADWPALTRDLSSLPELPALDA